MLEKLILDGEPITKISNILSIPYGKTRKLVFDFLDNDKTRIDEYKRRASKKCGEHLSVVKKGKKKKSRKMTVDRVLATKPFANVYVTDVQREFIEKCLTDTSKIWDGKAYKFLVEYITHRDDDKLIIGEFDEWYNTYRGNGKKYNYNLRLFQLRFNTKAEDMLNTRKENTNSLQHMTEEEKEQYKQRMSVSVKQVYKDRPMSYNREKNCICIDFWTKRGFTKDEAVQQIAEIQSKNCNKRLTKYSKEELRDQSNTSLQFYLNKGMTEEEAKKALSNRQSTFSLDKCIEKHGVEEGTKKWKDRQDRWQATLNDKTEEEKLAISVSKFHGNKKGSASAQSLKFFKPLISKIESEFGFTSTDYHIGLEENKEWFFYDRKNSSLFFYDFCLPSLKIVVEFHGVAYHYDKELKCIPNNFHRLDEHVIKNRDEAKEALCISNGFIYEVVWERKGNNYEQDIQRIVGRIRDIYISSKSTIENP